MFLALLLLMFVFTDCCYCLLLTFFVIVCWFLIVVMVAIVCVFSRSVGLFVSCVCFVCLLIGLIRLTQYFDGLSVDLFVYYCFHWIG